MDAVKYLQEKKRMCESYTCCIGCPIKKVNGDNRSCVDWWQANIAEAVRIVEEWSKEHPVQTRREKFREVFGEDPVNNLTEEYVCPPASVRGDIGCSLKRCDECSSAYWDEPYEAPKGADK